jgi:hypothetical protein
LQLPGKCNPDRFERLCQHQLDQPKGQISFFFIINYSSVVILLKIWPLEEKRNLNCLYWKGLVD